MVVTAVVMVESEATAALLLAGRGLRVAVEAVVVISPELDATVMSLAVGRGGGKLCEGMLWRALDEVGERAGGEIRAIFLLLIPGELSLACPLGRCSHWHYFG